MTQHSVRLQFGLQAQRSLQRGFNQLADLLAISIGPLGRNVAITRDASPSHTPPDLLRTSAEIARRFYALPDPFESMGLRLARRLSHDMAERIGDGSATAVVMAQAMLTEGMKCIAAGYSPMPLRYGIEQAIAAASQAIEATAQPIKAERDIAAMARAIVGNDTLAKLISECLDVVGEQGHIEVRPSQSVGHDREYISGVMWNEGWASSHFVTQGSTARLENPYVLCTTYRLSEVTQLLPIMTAINEQPGKRGLVVIAFAIEGQALNLLLTNKARGVMPTLAINAPGVGDDRFEILQDLAVLTGAKLVAEEAGDRMDRLTLADLGQADEIQAIRSAFTVVGGKGRPAAMRARANELRKLLPTATDHFVRDRLSERIGKLLGGVALLRVGGASESERDFLQKRCEIALRTLRVAVQGGVVAGGGAAYLAALDAVNALDLSPECKPAQRIVRAGLLAPMRRIVQNQGGDPAPVLQQAQQQPNHTYDVFRNTLVPAFTNGIVDPLTLTITALQTAASTAIMALTVDALVHQPRQTRDSDVELTP